MPFLSSSFRWFSSMYIFSMIGNSSIPFTRLSRLLCMKFTLSMNLKFPSVKDMYFSVFVGMHLISPLTLDIACIIRCPS